MSIKKIVYLLEDFFNERDYRRFGIQTMLDCGFDVEIWDFTPLIAADGFLENYSRPFYNAANYRLFFNKREALSAVARLDNTCFLVSGLHYNYKTFKIYRLITKKKIPYCIFAFALPISSTKTEVLTRRIKRLLSFNWGAKLFKMIPFEMLGIRPVDLVLAQGKEYVCTIGGYPVNDKSRIVWTHSFDYDIYLEENYTPIVAEEKLCVFLDDYLPLHPDYAYLESAPKITVEEYYSLMRSFFDFFEKAHGARVVIAAHPKSDYDSRPDLFGKRDVIRGKTAELVRKAGFVMLHNSTSINFAVLYKKPMIFLTSDKIEESRLEDPSIEWLASYFGKKAHNLDQPPDVDFKKEMAVDEAAYNAYKDAYIKKEGSQELPFWHIVANTIKESEW